MPAGRLDSSAGRTRSRRRTGRSAVKAKPARRVRAPRPASLPRPAQGSASPRELAQAQRTDRSAVKAKPARRVRAPRPAQGSASPREQRQGRGVVRSDDVRPTPAPMSAPYGPAADPCAAPWITDGAARCKTGAAAFPRALSVLMKSSATAGGKSPTDEATTCLRCSRGRSPYSGRRHARSPSSASGDNRAIGSSRCTQPSGRITPSTRGGNSPNRVQPSIAGCRTPDRACTAWTSPGADRGAVQRRGLRSVTLP